MPDVIAVRLHPTEPVDPAAFEGFLTGLTVSAYAFTFATPDPGGPGDAPVAVAQYLPGDADNRIVQHVLTLPPAPTSIATAYLDIPPGVEYDRPDLILRADRNGNAVAEDLVAYNVATTFVGTVPESEDVIPSPVAAYLALPDPALDLTPGVAHVTLPPDGSPPPFGALRTAVETVLNADPGGAFDIAALSIPQCRHVANEIAWNRHTDPLPEPPEPLAQMYTTTLGGDSDDSAQARNRFRAELLADRAEHDADVERLTQAIYALSAAIWCERMTTNAQRVRFTFPITRPRIDGRIAEGAVDLRP